MAVAKANGLDLDLVPTEPAKGVSTDYLKLNKLGKIPTFEGQDGYVLTEAMAIAIYSEYTTSPLRPFAMMKDQYFSYPCLKTTVENVFTL